MLKSESGDACKGLILHLDPSSSLQRTLTAHIDDHIDQGEGTDDCKPWCGVDSATFSSRRGQQQSILSDDPSLGPPGLLLWGCLDLKYRTVKMAVH